MGSASNELRIFISSTFRDLQEEREYLVKKVFPEIRSLCRARGVTFTEVDLRWGLTEEDQTFGRIIRACLEEIDRCRPWFIGIIGDRYGYIPGFAEIQKDPQLLDLFPWIEDAALDGASIIDLEFSHAALNNRSQASDCHFYIRQRRDDGNSSAEGDATRLDGLIERVRTSGSPVEDFDTPHTLGELVSRQLASIIERNFSEAKLPTPLEEERARHRTFAASRRHAYIANAANLTRLNNFATSNEDGVKRSVLLIHGESGSGKSALVAHWAAQYQRRNPEAFVVEHYVGISTGNSDHLGIILHVMMEIKERLGLDRELPVKPDEIEGEFPDWLAAIRTTPMVLVIDGVNQLQGVAASFFWLPKRIPSVMRVIMTSTMVLPSEPLGERGWDQMVMMPLTLDEREALIVRFLSEFHKGLSSEQVRRVADDPKSAQPLFLRTLLEELRLFGSYEGLEDKVGRLLSTASTEELFQRVLERLENDFGSSMVRNLMSLLLTSRDGLNLSDLVELTEFSWLNISSLLNALDYHLLNGDGLYTFFHNYLKRAVEGRYMQSDEETKRSHARLSAYFSTQPYDDRRRSEEPWNWSQAGELEKLKECIGTIPMLRLFCSAGKQYELLAYWRTVKDQYDLVETYSRALEDFTPDSDVARLKLLHDLGTFYIIADNHTAAELEFRRALETATQLFGDHHLRTAQALDDLGTVLYHEGQFIDAEFCWEKTLGIQEEILGDSDPILCTTLDSLVTIASKLGHFDEAETICRRSLALSESNFGLDHPKTAERVSNLAALWNTRGDYHAAIPLMQRVVTIMEQGYGEEDIRTAQAIRNLGGCLNNAGKLVAAELAHRRALEIYEPLLDKHTQVADTYSALAGTLARQGRVSEAEAYYRNALQINVDLRGADHISTIQISLSLARVFGQQGLPEEAIALYRRFLPKKREILGDEHPSVRNSIEVFVNLLRELGRNDEADAMLMELGLNLDGWG